MFLRTTSSAIALIALSGPVLADVTPVEVWQNWVSYYQANGYTVTEGSRDEAGDTLTLKNVVLSFKAPADEGSVELTIPEVTLSTTGDGKVRTTTAASNPIKGVFKNEDGEQVQLDAVVTLKDADIVSSGSAADMTHTSKAAEMGVALESITTSEGKKPLPVALTFKNVATTQRNVDGNVTTVESTMSADRLDMTANIEGLDAEDPTAKFSLTGGMDALTLAGTGALPKGVDPTKDMNAAIKAGLAFNGNFTAGAGKFTVQFAGADDEGKPVAGSLETDLKGFDLSGAISAAGIKYQGSSDASSVKLVMPNLPKPISYAMEGSSFDMQFPVMKADEPAPYKLAYSLSGLTISDELWDLFDAAKTLPRTPATLDLDVTGLVKITMDLFDPANLRTLENAAEDQADTHSDDHAGHQPGDEAAANPADAPAAAGAPNDAAAPAAGDSGTQVADAGTDTESGAEPEMPSPFEPVEITINKAALDAVGAKIDISGALTMPQGGSLAEPVGQISARLDGVNALIDNLIKIGLITEEDAGSYRMMSAMFLRPAPEGGDALVGDYEFKEGGEVFANGQKVK